MIFTHSPAPVLAAEAAPAEAPAAPMVSSGSSSLSAFCTSLESLAANNSKSGGKTMPNDFVETADLWDTIISDYKEARHCLWCPKNANNWHREENRGYYYLWKAYHFAEEASKKRPLWYARILYRAHV